MVLIDIQYGLPTKAMVPTVLSKCLAVVQPALTLCPPYSPGPGGHNSFSKKVQDGQWPQNAMKEEKAGNDWAPKLQSICNL